jgi:type VI protein secretion system component VasF
MYGRLFVVLTTLLLTAANALAQDTTAAQEGFRPASELPPGQQLPAAPFLVGSYAFFLVLMMFYLWTIWRRIDSVEKEMRDLERRQGAAKR